MRLQSDLFILCLTLRADRRIDLSPDWQLAFRTDLPMLATNPIAPDNPGGEFRYGMGDAVSSRRGSYMTSTHAGPQVSDLCEPNLVQSFPASRFAFPVLGEQLP
jgi:hypothetical protein